MSVISVLMQEGDNLQTINRILKRIPDGIVIILLFYFCLLPIIGVVLYGASAGDGKSIGQIMEGILPLLKNSLVLSCSVTVISVALAVAISFTLNRLVFPGRKLLKILALLPLVNPAFVGSLSYIMLFGKRGLITYKLLGLSISPFGWQSVMFLQVVNLTTIAYLVISGSVNSTNVDLEDAARNLGAGEGYILTRVSLPIMAPEIAVTALLVFLASMADFSTPVAIGGSFKTLASDLYVQIIGTYDMKTASITGIVLLIPCALVFFLQSMITGKRRFSSDGTSGKDITYRMCPRALRMILIAVTSTMTLLFFTIFIFIFVGAFTKAWGHDYSFTLAHASEVLGGGLRRYVIPLWNSLKLSLLTGFLTAVFGITLAYRVQRKKMLFPKLVDFMCLIPAAVPGTLFGIGYLVTFKYSLFGVGEYILPSAPKMVLLGTTGIIYIICITRQMNLSMKSCYALLEHMEPDILNAAYNLGASQLYTTLRILVPLLKDAFMNAFLRIFSATMSTLGAIIFLILPKNKVIIQILFQRISSDSLGVCCFVAVMLSVTTLGLMLLIYTAAYGKDILYQYRRKHRNHEN